MASFRRLRGLVHHHRYRVVVFFSLILTLVYVVNNTGFVCNNRRVEQVVEQLCNEYATGFAMGTLCEPLCKKSSLSALSCATNSPGKEIVFSTQWDDQLVIVKSAFSPGKRSNKSESIGAMTEEMFRGIVRNIVSKKLNISVTNQQVERLTHLTARPLTLSPSARHLEKQQVLTLLQSQEYLLSVLFADRDIFPQVYGTCGHLYAVERVNPPDLDSFFAFNGQHVWSARMKFAILIMELLEQLETDFPDPLRLCDVKMNHFGLTNLGRLKYLDLDVVHTDNVLQKMTGGRQPCQKDEDCDLFDCKASCNAQYKRCEDGVSNNNLQVVCEKVFVGWTMSGKLMVPGLLMTENTPASLASLLRQCAENGRMAVPEDIRQRLYTTLTEMDQILTDRLS